MKKYAVIVAGGTGTRMGSVVPKQFLQLNGKPVIGYTLETFLRAYEDMQVILVIPAGFEEEGKRLIQQTGAPGRIQMVQGGETRFHSVQNGLQKVNGDAVVFVHDGVRCLVSEDLIRRCYIQAVEKGSAIPAVAVNDSIRIVEGDGTRAIDRSRVLAVQTPQTFRSEIILPVFQQHYSTAFTDEATVAEAAGYQVFMIAGERENMKITLPADLVIAEQLLKKR
ncbi:MAG: 2-C-methyl-D-erythritol 4-phosphate cytidylyltransferase [Chitinophagaceae bacterium]|nr:2-C-methyl-D-erythritol 4-phosphate cytidylyltransferase [Chitinophagaceae bacterium]